MRHLRRAEPIRPARADRRGPQYQISTRPVAESADQCARSAECLETCISPNVASAPKPTGWPAARRHRRLRYRPSLAAVWLALRADLSCARMHPFGTPLRPPGCPRGASPGVPVAGRPAVWPGETRRCRTTPARASATKRLAGAVSPARPRAGNRSGFLSGADQYRDMDALAEAILRGYRRADLLGESGPLAGSRYPVAHC